MNEDFYKNLQGFKTFSELTNSSHYHELPNTWFVAITDVIGSTKAIQSGQYKNVNALGVASIVALLNAIKPIEAPYVFGGDGATVCFPLSRKDSVEICFQTIHEIAQTQFHLEMRTGIVSIEELLTHNKKILIAKYIASKAYHQAMFLGDGVAFAESLIKKDTKYLIQPKTSKPGNMFNGFECRWQEIPSPHDETIALMVQSTNQKAETYDKIIAKIEEIYGNENRHHPLTKNNLNLGVDKNKPSAESLIRTFKQSFFFKKIYRYLYTAQILIGNFLMRHHVKLANANWGTYKETLIQNTDYRKFDEVLRMIISGDQNQRNTLREYLETLKNKNEIVYGIHASKNALMTCMIFDYNENHIHFLDVADGGYAMAAKELKAQLKEKEI